MSCPSVNSGTEENCFFCPDGIHWDAHKIGWAVAGGCAALTTLITLFTLTMHARNYQNPALQRQVMRILMMPCVYAIVSFLSYRYYWQYYYFSIGETAYESVTLSAFLMLLMEIVSLKHPEGNIQAVLADMDKRKLPFPFNFWRFRASKPYFWHTLSFSVMQYVIIRPLLSVIGIICEYFNVQYSIHFAEVYLDAVDFVSISVALYGLIVFYVLFKDVLSGKNDADKHGEPAGKKRGWRPLSKFLAIKLIVFFTFYQSFVFSLLQDHDAIKGTSLWTATNVANGLQALCTCVEMVFFSIYMGWAYSWTDFTNPDLNPAQRQTGWRTYFQAIWDAVNIADFAEELVNSTHFFIAFLRGKPGTRGLTKMQRTFLQTSAETPMGDMKTEPPAADAYAPSQQQYPERGGNAYPYNNALPSPESYSRLAEEEDWQRAMERTRYGQQEYDPRARAQYHAGGGGDNDDAAAAHGRTPSGGYGHSYAR